MSWMPFLNGWPDPVAKRSPVTCWSFPAAAEARFGALVNSHAYNGICRRRQTRATQPTLLWSRPEHDARGEVPMHAMPGKSRQSGQSNGPGVQLHLLQLVCLATRKGRSNDDTLVDSHRDGGTLGLQPCLCASWRYRSDLATRHGSRFAGRSDWPWLATRHDFAAWHRSRFAGRISRNSYGRHGTRHTRREPGDIGCIANGFIWSIDFVACWSIDLVAWRNRFPIIRRSGWNSVGCDRTFTRRPEPSISRQSFGAPFNIGSAAPSPTSEMYC
jgi:hypothetical protein